MVIREVRNSVTDYGGLKSILNLAPSYDAVKLFRRTTYLQIYLTD